ncbi:MAG: HAMP domain-containing histidine kinase [Oscillospiraceae bacterium]|nr:HAMP domain-containing histidine kinase [Oscillospiraceae bacterium]
MKIFTNNKIRSLFGKVLICISVFILFSLICFSFENTAPYIFICSLFMFSAISAAMYGYFDEQNKIIETAEAQITEYISGNQAARIECNDEGELYKLFHKVNSLVAILNAHADNELKSKEFLKNTISDISHQLKIPLAALNIYNGIMQSEAENLPEIKEFTDLTEQELDRMETLVQNLLKITRLDAGTIVLDKSAENVSEMMESVKERFSFRAGREGKKISLSGENNITLLCDRYWLTQAIDNIVKNALDHTTAGGHIKIEWKQFASVVQIIIKDNGSGIHPEDLHCIFKRFYRSRFSKDTQGIGLGLPLAKVVIESHNGNIEVDSELDRGTTFTINFLIPTKL